MDAERYCLGLISEEAGEVLQLIGKCSRFGIDTPGHMTGGVVDGQTPRTMMPAELGDLLAAIDFTLAHGLFDRDAVEAARTRKIEKLLDPSALDNLGRPLAPQPSGT